MQVFDEAGNDVTPQPLLAVDPALKAAQSKNVFGGGESSIGTVSISILANKQTFKIT